MEGLRITKLQRHPEHGYWRARVSTNGDTIPVQCRFGSWMSEPEKSGRMREVRPAVAAEIQRKVRTEEGRERRAEA